VVKDTVIVELAPNAELVCILQLNENAVHSLY
jgi:hypothetical protein